MNESDVLQLFNAMNCAKTGNSFAPHKPALVLLILEKISKGHENRFHFNEFDADLRRILYKFGSANAPASRNEPFWRLQNDKILEISKPISFLVEQYLILGRFRGVVIV